MLERILIDAVIGAGTWVVGAGGVKGLGRHFGWWEHFSENGALATSLLWPFTVPAALTAMTACWVAQGPKKLFTAAEDVAAKLSKFATGKEPELEVRNGQYYQTRTAGELVDESRYWR